MTPATVANKVAIIYCLFGVALSVAFTFFMLRAPGRPRLVTS
jgi:hypothetical protein